GKPFLLSIENASQFHFREQIVGIPDAAPQGEAGTPPAKRTLFVHEWLPAWRPRYLRRNTMKGLLTATTVSLMLAGSPWAIAQVQTPPSPNAQVQTPPSPNAQVQTPPSPNAQTPPAQPQTSVPKTPVAGQIVVQDANTVLAKQDLI